MREIKFKAVRYDDGDLTKIHDDVTGIDYDEDFSVHNARLEDGDWVLNIIPLQFTGHLDKRDKEIYEDDLVADEYGRIYQVVFKGDCWRCEPKPFRGRRNRWISNFLEIIGNVHENPELLEENAE